MSGIETGNGWSFDNGMSNNAVAAYDNGFLPASKIPGIPAALIQKHIYYEEWHHSSKFHNKTKFYNPHRVFVEFGFPDSENCDCGGKCRFSPNQVAVEELKSYKEKKNGAAEIYENCRVEMLEWHGTIKKPFPVDVCHHLARVEVKRNTATITTREGKTFKKRLTTKGFSFSVMSEEEIAAFKKSLIDAEREAEERKRKREEEAKKAELRYQNFLESERGEKERIKLEREKETSAILEKFNFRIDREAKTIFFNGKEFGFKKNNIGQNHLCREINEELAQNGIAGNLMSFVRSTIEKKFLKG